VQILHARTDRAHDLIEVARTPSPEPSDPEPWIEILPFKDHGNRIGPGIPRPLDASGAISVQPRFQVHLILREEKLQVGPHKGVQV
jgi:hypothetical protein